ncbi:MAG: DUF6308 family protein [Actinomycetota bacterium]
MNPSTEATELVLGRHRYPNALDDVRRYCGLAWSGGPPEVWAFEYYDRVRTDQGRIDRVDVLSAAALHPGLSRSDLTWFSEHAVKLDAWLESFEPGCTLLDASDEQLQQLDELVALDGVSLTLLTKVLHRKRPNLVPLLDRHVVDRYRSVTGERRPFDAWKPLLRCLRGDLAQNQPQIRAIQAACSTEADGVLSDLRVIDITIWMAVRS